MNTLLDHAISQLGGNPMLDKCRHTLNDLKRAVDKRRQEAADLQIMVEELDRLMPLIYCAYEKQNEDLLWDVRGLQGKATQLNSASLGKYLEERQRIIKKFDLE